MNSKMILGLSAVASLAAMTALGPALAAECVHGPISLPALSGPPVWAGAAGTTDWRPQLHDPRWVGAPVQLFTMSSTGTAALANAQYRLLHDAGKLYVSIQVLADADTTATDFVDAVYFGFVEGGAATGARIVSIAPNRGTPVAAPGAGVPSDDLRPVHTDAGFINYYETTNTTVATPTWTPHSGAMPTWLVDDVATWNDSPGVAWAVTFKIDLGLANSLMTSKFFVGVRVGNGASTTYRLANSTLATADDPATAPNEDNSINGETILLPTVGSWVDYSVPGAACSTGAYVDYNNVGRLSGSSLISTINACGGAGTPCPAAGLSNTFRVKVQNVVNTVLPTPHSVRANIRIADWGSTIANWDFAPWKQIDGISETVFTDAAGTFASPPWTWSSAPGATHGQAIIDFQCAPSANSYCPKLANADNYGGDQCMLVEIAGGPGFQNQVPIATTAVYRNMQFVGLSTFEHKAKITIEGLQKLLSQAADRDVYLHVQTLNMPSHGSEPVFQNVAAMKAALSYADNPPQVPWPAANPKDPPSPLLRGPQGRAPAAAKAPTVAAADQPPAAQAAAAALSPKMSSLDVPVMTSSQALESAWPTYKVYPYFDTGKTSKLKGQTFKSLEPMAPFGYYLEHNGPLYGFTHSLAGTPGVTVTKVAENLFKIHIKNEGSVDVSTTITAEEKRKDEPKPCPECPPHPHKGCGCTIPGQSDPAQSDASTWWPLAALGLGALLLARRRLAA